MNEEGETIADEEKVKVAMFKDRDLIILFKSTESDLVSK